MTIQLDRSGKLIHEKLILADRAVFNDFVCAFFLGKMHLNTLNINCTSGPLFG